MAEMKPSTTGLVYVVGSYPLLTTTFIDREIEWLRRSGVEIQVIAMRRPDPGSPFSEAQKMLQQGVIYLLPSDWRLVLLSHVYFLARRPLKYMGIFLYLISRRHSGFKSRIKTIFHFAEGVLAAYLLRDRKFRELHAHFVDRAATVALVAGRLLGSPYSLSIHAGADIYVDPVLIREKLLHARHAVTCTRYNKRHLLQLAGEDLKEKITCIPHGLELEKYSPTKQHVNGRPLILSVGQLKERKGFIQLIQACGQLKDMGYRLDCQIVGRGPQQVELQRLIVELALQDTVTLAGALPHDQVIEKYRRAALFVLPCIQTAEGDVDGIPNVLAEAMASQVPVVSTDISAIPELVKNHENGLLVPQQDVPALAEAIAHLLDQPDLRGELGRNGRKTVLQTFDVELNVRKFAETLWPEILPNP